jgi:hypothetical protein
VKSGDLHVGVAVRDERVHPLLHLGGRLVGEGRSARTSEGRARRAAMR